MATLTFKNYRAFSDESPLKIQFGKQFTALVGPNNSGKSSFLLSFFELRQLWGQLQGGNLPNLMVPTFFGVSDYPSVADDAELFHNTHHRPITIELDVSDEVPHVNAGAPKKITKLVAQCNYANRRSWFVEVFAGEYKVVRPSNNDGSGWLADIASGIFRTPNGTFDFSDVARITQDFVQTLYIGPFRSTISQVTGAYYDLEIGSKFIVTWNNWKSGPSKEANLAVESIKENIKEIFKFKQLEINPQASGEGLHVWIDSKPYRLAELGAGLSQFIFVFANAAIKKPRLILIDEPELNLHPMLQVAFLTSLASYASSGIVFATHSVGLARSVADEIYTFRKQESAAIVRPFEGTASYAEFLGEMSFAAFQENGYDRVLLVEGVNDVRTVHQLLRLMHKEHRVVVLQLGGNEMAIGGRQLELGEIRRLSDHIFALVDSEREKAGDAAAQKRLDFGKVCGELKIPICITERRAIENYLSDRAVKIAFGEKYRSLAPFEPLSAAAPAWKKAESWRAARQMSLDEIKGTDVYAFLERL